jgi:predicted nucleic acid-binding protein
VTEAQARFACASVAYCFDIIHSSDSLIERAIAMAVALQHPIYDCLYLACAERAGAQLATADRRLVAAAQGSAFASLVVHVDDVA